MDYGLKILIKVDSQISLPVPDMIITFLPGLSMSAHRLSHFQSSIFPQRPAWQSYMPSKSTQFRFFSQFRSGAFDVQEQLQTSVMFQHFPPLHYDYSEYGVLISYSQNQLELQVKNHGNWVISSNFTKSKKSEKLSFSKIQ